MAGWLDSLLFKWARMSLRAADGGLGYGASALSRMVPSGRYGGWAGGSAWETSKTDIIELDGIIQTLPTHIKQCLIAFYQLEDGKKSPAARRIGICRHTLARHLSTGHTMILRELERKRAA